MSTFSDLLAAATEIEETNLNKNEKIREVVAAFKKCYDLHPSNDETKRKYLSYFKRQFELEHIKKNQEELKLLGNAQVQQDRYEEAVIIYDASIDLDPSIESAAPIYSNRSLCFFNLGRFQEAEDDGCMSIFLRPEFARGYLRRGNAAMKLEKYREASEAFEKYFELDPESAKSDPDLVKNRNLMKKQFHQHEAAIRNRERLIEKTRTEIMAIKDDKKRKKKATDLVSDELRNPRTFDVDLARMLVECGADLAPTPFRPHQVAVNPTPLPETISLFISLLVTRLEVSPKILPHFDELLFFVIEEMLRLDVPFLGWELCLACSCAIVGHLNSTLLRVLLETNKFDVNRNFGQGQPAPLASLVAGMIVSVEMPQEAPDCLHLLLNWKGVDVNATSEVRLTDGSVVQMTALGFVRHPEVARILIRYGANVNAVFNLDSGESSNVLNFILRVPDSPGLEELVRLFIQSGARLLPNGRDKKSSETMVGILSGVIDEKTKKKSFVSEEVLQMILQLNLHQGFLFRWQCTTNSMDRPFLLHAVSEGAPLRFVELLCAMTPEPMKQTGTYKNGRPFSVADALAMRILDKTSSFEESMRVLGLLLEHGFDLFAALPHNVATSAFVVFWSICREINQDLNLLKKTIIDKRGEEEFQRCMKTVK